MIRSNALVLLSRASLVAAVIAATGCGGGGGATRGLSISTGRTISVASDPLEVLTDRPVGDVKLTFIASSALVPTTVNEVSVTVSDTGSKGGFVTGAVAYDAASRTITWTLAQTGLNSKTPHDTVFANGTKYRARVDGIRSTLNEPLSQAFTLDFTTEAVRLGIVAADPQPGEASACVEPYPIYLTSATFNAIVAAQVDDDLAPASVNTTTVHIEESAGGHVPPGQIVSYDASSRIVMVGLDPQAGAGEEAKFPAAAILRFSTGYKLVIGKGVQLSSTTGSPAADVSVAFTTAGIAAPSAPTSTSDSLDLMINEVLADIPASGASMALDANKDNMVDGTQDEFVELLNLSSSYLDLSAFTITEMSAGGTSTAAVENLWVRLPGTTGVPDVGALLAPRRALTIFGGGRPNGRLMAMGRSKWVNGQKNPGSGVFNNNGTGDIVRLRGPSTSGTTGTVFSIVNFRASAGGVAAPSHEAVNRMPDGSRANNNIGSHAAASGSAALVCSPGRKADGTLFK